MPDIPVGSQIFDIAFHPSNRLVYVGLLTGGVKAFRYDEQGEHEEKFLTRISKKSCRGLVTNEDGTKLYAVGKGKALHTLDTTNGKIVDSRLDAHQAPINRIKRLSPHLLSTGDDDGVVKLWDPRKREAIHSYDHHFDFISDFLWIESKKHVVVTSGDGSLSVIDVRSSKAEPFAHSEDQEDELLSIVSIRGGEKTVVGTQIGILSIFNRSSGWGDCVDRVPGHPHSIDALCNLPSSYTSAHSTILTGSSDGLLRAVQLFPTKLLGVIADHGEFPIERIAVDMGGEGRWVGSVGHDEVLRMTDLVEVLEEDGKVPETDDRDREEQSGDASRNDEEDERNEGKESEDEDEEGSRSGKGDSSESDGENDLPPETGTSRFKNKGKFSEEDFSQENKRELLATSDSDGNDGGALNDSDSEPVLRKRRKQRAEDPLAVDKKRRRKPRKDEVIADPNFFAGL